MSASASERRRTESRRAALVRAARRGPALSSGATDSPAGSVVEAASALAAACASIVLPPTARHPLRYVRDGSRSSPCPELGPLPTPDGTKPGWHLSSAYGTRNVPDERGCARPRQGVQGARRYRA